MITLTTGLPGACKTLWTLNYVKRKAEKENRQVYYSGIADLALPWEEIDPQKWFECPAGSIIVIDECQRVYRPRANGSQVPDWVSKLETHRHMGHDIFFVTQHPLLVDSNVRRLVGQHFHCVRAFGLQASTVHEWAQCKENCDKSRADSAAQHKFKFPKESFNWYKSAEVHTHKSSIPMKVWILLFLVLALPVFSYWIWHRLQSRADAPLPAAAPVSSSASLPGASPAGDRPRAKSMGEYLADMRPRVEGLAYTAPAYDDVTRPVRAPYPAACIQSKTRCQCYTQQGTRLDVPRPMCEGIAAGGFFIAWDENKGQGAPVQAVPRSDRSASSEPLPGYLNLTPGHTAKGTQVALAEAAQAQQDGQGIRAARRNP